MRWSREFSAPIVLNDGREIVTLNDARVVMRSLPAQSQSSKAWLYVDGLLPEMATSGGPIDETTDDLKRALKADGPL